MVKIIREVQADQWLSEHHGLPEGMFLCRPEVCWSADRKLVYFTYADLHPRHWIDVEERPFPAPDNVGFCGGLKTIREDGSEYWRQTYPFAFYSVKSEASIKRDHRPVYLDKDDKPLVEVFLDFCHLEGWTNPLPPRAEFRVTDGGYGRGFRPYYLSPGDWLIRNETPGSVRVVSDAEFQAMQA